MQQVIQNLSDILEKYGPMLRQMPEGQQLKKSSPGGWNKKQELGHLVDSAQNNIQRFIRVQYQPAVKIAYNPDAWNAANDYTKADWNDLVGLWYLLNKQVIRILSVMPETEFDKPVDVGQDAPSVHPLVFIAEDYTTHMQHHLDHMLPE